MMRKFATTIATMGALAVALLPASGAGAAPPDLGAASLVSGAEDRAAPTVDMRLNQLPRGRTTSRPHLEGRTIVEGSRRIDLRAARAQTLVLIGWTEQSYLVGTAGPRANRGRLWRIDHDGRQLLLGKGFPPFGATASPSGHRIVAVRRTSGGSELVMLSTDRAQELHTLSQQRQPSVVAVGTGRVVFGVRGPAARVWNVRSGRVSDLTTGVSPERADFRADLLASYDGSGDSCRVLTRLSQPEATLWRSCREQVIALQPEGRRFVTVDSRTFDTQGQPPHDAILRGTNGTPVLRLDGGSGTYVDEAYVGKGDRVLLRLSGNYGRRALVQCDPQGCERVSRWFRVVQ